MGRTIQRQSSSVEDSFVKDIGPHKILTTGEPVLGIGQKAAVPIRIGRVKTYGERSVYSNG